MSAPTTLLFGALMVASGTNFAYHLLAGRLLAVADYGLLSAVASLIASVSLPATALEVSITRSVADASAHRRIAIKRWLWTAGAIGGVAAGTVALIAPVLRAQLGISEPAVIVLLAAYFPVMSLGLVVRGICLGRLRYGRATVVVMSGAIVRMLTVAGGAAWFGITGALVATVAAESTLTAGHLLAARHDIARDGVLVRIDWQSGLLSAAALGGFWLLVNADTVLARMLLPPRAAGSYAAASVVAKTALFAPQAVVHVMYPRFVAEPGRRSLLLRKALLAAGALGCSAALVLSWRPVDALVLLFGDQLATASSVLGGLAVVAAGLGLTSVLLHYRLAMTDSRALGCWVGFALTVIIALGGTPSSAWLLASVGAGVFVSAVIMATGARSHEPDAAGQSVTRLDEEPGLDLTVVIPFYNGGSAVRDTVERVIAQLRQTQASFELIAVSDGSTDDSLSALDLMDDPVLTVVRLDTNEGKGAAVSTGLRMGRGRYLGFIDADGDIDPGLWRPFLTLLALYQPDVVLGSKRHPLSDTTYPRSRRCYSWGYQQLTRLLFNLNVRDTQTGIKLVRRDVLAAVLPRMVERRFTFDLELLAVARHLGYRRFLEAPIRLHHRQFSSTVSWHTVFDMARDTLAIFLRLRLLRCYDRTPMGREPFVTSRALRPVETGVAA